MALCDYLMQRARPQRFANALPAAVKASAMAAIDVLEAEPERGTALPENTRYLRQGLLALGFRPLPGDTPIVPVILGETAAAIRISELLLDEGVSSPGSAFRSCSGAGPRALPDLAWAYPGRPRSGAGRLLPGWPPAGADLNPQRAFQ